MATSPPKSPPEIIADLWELLKAYAKQETIDELAPLKRYLGWWIGGGVAIAIGGFFLALGALRGLQQIDQFQGFWSFAPYLIVSVTLGLWAYLFVRRIGRDDHPAPAPATVLDPTPMEQPS